MQAMQRELRKKYEDRWGKLGPDKAKDSLLWTYGELGEVGDILKKEGPNRVMDNPETRARFIEEFCDVLMHLNELCLCLDISPEEIENSYREKHRRNLCRW